ncbi:MAG: hypothetical protein Q9227_002425 [Pyrenula ochraceoflavens]
MATSPNKPAGRAAQLADPSTIPLPASPQKPRSIRRLQSHQQLSSNSPSLITQQRQQQQRYVSLAKKDSKDSITSSAQTASISIPARTRANSDAPLSMRKGPSKKPYGLSHGRKSSLEVMLREGPTTDNLEACLNDLRYKILVSKVEAGVDGMSAHRIYLWLTLLTIPPLPTDTYLTLVRRGRSPVHQKISDDTFRTLATDPLFKRRVSDASIARLLNATAWALHDAKASSSSLSHKPILPSTTDTYPLTISPISPDSALYVQGMNVLSAPFLYAARSETEAFALFHHFITVECPGYIRGAMEGVHRGLSLVDKCLSIVEPKLATFLLDKGMNAELYAFPSVLTFCACTPPLPEVLHLWDFLFAYGPHLNVLCIVAQLLGLKDELLRSSSPTKILRSFPQLNAEKIIGLTLLALKKIPDDVYEELVVHAK